MSEVVCTLLCSEARQERADATAKAALGSLGGFAQIRLQLAEGHLDRVEIGGVFRQVAQLCPDGFDRFFDPGDFVGLKVVHHHNIAAVEGGNQTVPDVNLGGWAS